MLRTLNVSVGWFLGYSGPQVVWDDESGVEQRSLPLLVKHFESRIDDWGDLVRDHYRPVDDVDVTTGWDDEDVRLTFVAEAAELQAHLQDTLATDWQVVVSPEPGVAQVWIAGEYMCTWPLWVADGGTGPESWPMLSASMIDRLEAWAEQADPDHGPEPTKDVTRRLRQDLQRELGPRFRVTA